ncbi:hypothetical protein [Leptolyngbya sp. FACHB-711]|uniref:hypothetical protein n=1 Tax=Leptolyngbya sp. FACHB-711 TaxID=2692813 RepID=UPI001685A78B|nr:hypothetical protein [Leptolyngbya sp. FACHB-711]MBD2026164.1 hypothetical protein [Leptolyngbya sp. FACHB-711]
MMELSTGTSQFQSQQSDPDAAGFNQQQALQAGFQCYLAKPIEPAVLIIEITRLLKTRPPV